MDLSSKELPDGFNAPTDTPKDDAQRARWQAANREWWESHPMRYDFTKPIETTVDAVLMREGLHTTLSLSGFDEVDARFFKDAAVYMPWRKVPFERLIDFEGLKDKDVLEIGVGCGSHAGLLAKHAKSFTGIDLTDYAVQNTRARLSYEALKHDVRQMDAEKMTFPDASFDFVWSWGVVHHSSNTAAILAEIARVLRPGGRAVTMVYHRSFWNYYVMGGFFHGIVRGKLKGSSLHAVVQKHIDGALARYYSSSEWKAMASQHLKVESVRIYGSKMELIPLPGGSMKNLVAAAIPNFVSRFFTNTCRMGTFLVSEMRKK